MVWSEENKEHFVLLLRDNKDLLFGDWSPSVTKAARGKKWNDIALEMKARGAVFKDVRSLQKVILNYNKDLKSVYTKCQNKCFISSLTNLSKS
jgi:hypothetical protein